MGAERTSLVGREKDVQQALLLLEASERLVTIVGPAGVGKTRLAQHLSHRRTTSEPAHQVDLRPAPGPEQVAALVAAAVGAPLLAQSGITSVEQVGMALAERGAVLLVLDDFDHLVPHAETTVGRWLSMAPALRCLVTSRQALGIAGELRYELLPLSSDDATELFLTRARATSTRLVVTPAVHEVARRIAERLDCLPLAIELAAARASLLTLDQILARLDRRLDLLRVNAGGRGSTLRDAIEWSWSLLEEPERRALAALAVFSGGFTVAAATAVLGGDEVAALDHLTALRERSLLVASEARLDMLDSVRELALEKLDERGERAEAERRHAEHFLHAGEEWAANAHGPGAIDALHHLRLEAANLLAAGRVSLRDQPAVSVRLALALGEALALSGPQTLQLELLEHAVAAAETLADGGALHARALLLRGDARAVCGQRAGALADIEQAARRAREAGERPVEARALYFLGVFLRDDGDFDRARLHLESAAKLFASLGDHNSVGATIGSLATLFRQEGRFAAARTHYERALDQHVVGDRTAEGKVLAGLGHLAGASGQPDEAAARYRSALPLLRSVGDRRSEGIVLDHQALLALGRGAPAEALSLLDAARVELAAVGDRRLGALATAHRAVALARLGRIEEARADLDIAGRWLVRVDDARLTATLRVLTACVDLACADAAGDPDQARTLRESARKRGRDGDADERKLAAIPSDATYVEYLSDALRLLRNPVDGAETPAGRHTIEIGPGATWLRVGGGKRVKLSPLLARLLHELVEARFARPGVAVLPDALAPRLWPDEPMTPKATTDRLHAAVARLRRRGLEGVLMLQGGGYLLHPIVHLERHGAR